MVKTLSPSKFGSSPLYPSFCGSSSKPRNIMAIFPGNMIHKAANLLQHHARLIPMVKKNVGIIRCSKGRDYGSSFPSRYIPKKYSESEESEAPSPATNRSIYTKKHSSLDSDINRDEFFSKGSQTPSGSRSFLLGPDFETQDEKPNNNVHCDVEMGVGEEFDGDMLFEDLERMEEPEDVIEELELSSEKKRSKGYGIEVGRTKQEAEKQAVELLATRAFTTVELRKKLLGRKFPLVIVDAVIANFQSRGLINDGLYAETFSLSRWSSSTWGPRRIKKALFSKGVSNEDAEKAVKLVFNDAEDTGDQESKFGMSKHSMDHLLVQASKQWLRSHDASIEIRKSRLVRWLQYRGFSWDIIGTVLKKLESKYPP